MRKPYANKNYVRIQQKTVGTHVNTCTAGGPRDH